MTATFFTVLLGDQFKIEIDNLCEKEEPLSFTVV